MKTESCNPVLKTPKNIEVKGFIVAFTAVMIVIAYIVYYFYYRIYDIELNELYFIITGIGISVFTGTLFTFFKSLCARVMLLFTSTFYLMMILIYIAVWLILGQPYAYIKESLFIGLLIGIIYVVYDKFANQPRPIN